jgi:radical SAM superfamily enzyme YgiQ (UPF0313 family)
MKKILFAALNSSWSQSNLAQYYLREMIQDLDFCTVIKSYTCKEPLMQVTEDIYRQHADVICFSAYIWNRVYLQNLHKALTKILPQVTFVVGGPEAAAFENHKSTIVVFGAGEAAFRKLAEEDFRYQDGSLRTATLPLSQIPFPYHEADRDLLSDHLIYYECYRGCPYHCAYCLSANDDRHEPRFDLKQKGEIKRLYQELDALSHLGPRTLKFIDRSFNVQRDLAHAIWKYAIESKAEHDFHFEIYPDLLCDEDLQILSKAPEARIRFEIGVQSINSEVLELCGRHSDWQQTKAGLLALKQRTMVRVHADLILGLPGEDYASVLRGLDDLCACEPAAVQLGTLKILPDTPMQEIAQDRNYRWLDFPPYQVLSSDALSFDEICLLDDFAHLLGLYWNKEEYPRIWHELLQKYPASIILSAIKDIHTRNDLPFHSISKQRRNRVMDCLTDHLY